MAERWFKAWVVPEDHWLRVDMKWLGAWYDLIGLAEWKDGVKVKRGNMFDTQRGMVYFSISALADRWGWTWKTTKRFLNMLERDGMVHIREQNGEHNVFLDNYAKYQDIGANTEQSTGQSAGLSRGQSTGLSRGQSTGQSKSQFLPNKEEYKEHIEGESVQNVRAKRFTPPTLEMVRSYFSDQDLDGDPDYFFDYYEGNGWKISGHAMKDWKATARNWSRREKKQTTARTEPKPNKFNNFEQRTDQDQYAELQARWDEERRQRYG